MAGSAAFEREVERVDWGALRIQMGYAGGVPDALRALAAAETEGEADLAYWQLDNRVVVQGRLFEAAPHVIAPLLHILCEGTTIARRRAADLLVELVGPSAGAAPADQGGGEGLLEECRARARAGLEILYWLLGGSDADTRKWVVYVLTSIELDQARLLWTLLRVSESDVDAGVRDLAAHEVAERCRPGPLLDGVLGAQALAPKDGAAWTARPEGDAGAAGAWPSARGGSWVAFSRGLFERMTAEDAALVRRLRVGERWVWRDVASRCAEAWGTDWTDDPIAGRLLCEAAAHQLAEDPYAGGWA